MMSSLQVPTGPVVVVGSVLDEDVSIGSVVDDDVSIGSVVVLGSSVVLLSVTVTSIVVLDDDGSVSSVVDIEVDIDVDADADDVDMLDVIVPDIEPVVSSPVVNPLSP